MKEVEVSTNSVLEIIKENRIKHIEQRKAALECRRNAWMDRLTSCIEKINDDPNFQPPVSIMIDMPLDHTKAYDRAISMLEMSVNETITLSEREFNQYVRDEWEWKDNFAQLCASYS